MDEGEDSKVPKLEPLTIIYCGVCGVPGEYCEFDKDKYEKCKEWWKKNHPEMLEEAVANEPSKESSSSETKPAEKSEKPQKSKKKEKKAVVTLQLVNRGGRKFVTVVTGLESFGVDLKKATKTFSNKFACGCASSKTAAGGNELVIQGDFCDDLLEFIPETWENITEDDIELLEDKKGKR